MILAVPHGLFLFSTPNPTEVLNDVWVWFWACPNINRIANCKTTQNCRNDMFCCPYRASWRAGRLQVLWVEASWGDVHTITLSLQVDSSILLSSWHVRYTMLGSCSEQEVFSYLSLGLLLNCTGLRFEAHDPTHESSLRSQVCFHQLHNRLFGFALSQTLFWECRSRWEGHFSVHHNNNSHCLMCTISLS